MIFSVSVQNSSLMHSVEFSPDLAQIQERETVSGVFLARMDIRFQVWHMVEVMRRDFNEHHMNQVPITENQLGTMQMMEDVSERVGLNYPDTPDSRYVAQPVYFFIFPSEEGSVENPITIEEVGDSLSNEIQSSNHQDYRRRCRQDQLCAPLRTCKTFRTKLLDRSLFCK